MSKHLVFVYGTLRPSLRRAYDRWSWLPFGEERGRGTILGKLYQLSPTVPGVVFEGKGKVVGEVVEIDDKALRGFDNLEGHPTNYKRELVEVSMDDGSTLQAWCYQFPHIGPKDKLVKSGDWEQQYLSAVKIYG